MSKTHHTVDAPISRWRPLVFSVGWAGVMILSAATNLVLLERTIDAKLALLLIFFGIGGLLASLIVAALCARLPDRWRMSQRFAFAFVALAILTIGLTAFIFALHFRAYFAEWHDDELSVRLAFETGFTLAAAVYQFLVLALRLYLPIGVIALLGASWAFATKRI
jgi:hypothetical protein